MKPEELLNSLDHVGEDLLAEAEQNVLVRTKRPWIKTAVAAVLVVAAGVGGLLTLKHFTMRSSTPATEPCATSVTEPVRPVEALPKLELGNSWENLQGRMTVVSGDLDLCPDGITSLPVYRNLSGEENDPGICYSEEQMQTLLDEAIRRIGASPLGEVVEERYGNRLFYLTRNTDKGILSVWNNGDVHLDLDGRFDIAPERADSSEDMILTDGSPFSNDILSCVRRDQELLGLPEDLIVVYQEYSSVLIFPARSDPAEQLVVRSFDAVQQRMGSEHSSMNIIYWNQRLGAAGWYDAEPGFLELQGWYPTITLAEAKQMALEGKGFCIETKDLNLTEDRITGMELVYSDFSSEMRIPYYRFWFSRSFEALYGDNDDFCVCIPAIQPEFLSDWQPDSEVRTPVNTPVFTIRMDMYYYVSGYAGEVEALQFPGYEPEFAVTADVDGDGNEELVYLYTDGTHFVGIAAYGLDEGRPVVKGSTVFALNGRGARLDNDSDSGVWFSLSGNTEEDRSSTAIQARLSVEDGSIVLSEALPDECLIRADASFVKIACGDSYFTYEGKCYFTDGATMVWDLYSNGLIQKRNMLSGEEETLFELLFDEDSYTTLIGVTDERLYFCEYTQNGSTTYSVNYRNKDRRVEDHFAEHDQLVLRRTEDMRWEVWGPDGSVEALQYMGIREQIEKYADVDGDGKKELLYLFNGPTSGLYTMGIAVYGLDGGMPVLRAATILSLDYYDPSLRSDEAGNILLVLDPRFPAPEGTESVWFILSVEDGSIQFNGTLPAGCQIWGLPSDTGSEQELAATESQLTKGYFTKLSLNDRDYFSNGSTRIWQDGDKILRKDLSTGETESLFTLDPSDEIETLLIGVSENRLYFGWNEAEDWWGENVYSVNFRNGDRTEIGNALAYSFANGLLVLEDFRTDVRPITLQVIDGRDRKVADYKVCWCSTFVDDSLYFVYMPELQEYGKIEGTPAELRNRDVTLSYAVCRVEPDGSVTELGAIQRHYADGWTRESAWIDPETRTIFFDYADCYDLFTLALKTAELPEDLHELVEDSISVQGAYTDACDNLCDYSYTLPRLAWNSRDAIAINQEIDEIYGAYIRQVQSRKDGDASLEFPEISYEVAVWDHIVTIVISEDWATDFVTYDVYCYDCSAQRRLDTPTLLEKLGISQERFLDACRTSFRNRYEENTAIMPKDERAQYEKEFPEMLPENEKFVNLTLQAYPSEDGTLMTVAPIVTWVGASFYYHLIPVLAIRN